MSGNRRTENRYLTAYHAGCAEVNREWDQDNQQWWDWYMSLAENSPEQQTAELIQLAEPEVHAFPDRQSLRNQLGESYQLSVEQMQSFRHDGFIRLKNVLMPGALSLLRTQMCDVFKQTGAQLGGLFGSLEMMWETNQIIRNFVFSERLARLAAELLGVASVRLYHDNGLSKQPGCGRTPWHYDAHHFPIATEDVCTVWIPLQATPSSMGPLGFAKGIELVKLVQDIPFNKFDSSYDRQIIERFRDHNVQVYEAPFELGEISFHHNLNFHTAGPNRTTTPRMVLATTYFADGAKVIEAPHMVNGDWRRFMPGIEPGEMIDTPVNPVLYSDPSRQQVQR